MILHILHHDLFYDPSCPPHSPNEVELDFSLLEELSPPPFPGVRVGADEEIDQGEEHEVVPKVYEGSPGHTDSWLRLVEELHWDEVPHGACEQGAGVDEIPNEDSQQRLGG